MIIRKLRIGKTRSIKVADYQYFKPLVEIEADLDEDDVVGEEAVQLSAMVDEELDEMVKTETVRFRKVIEVRDLRRVMNEHDEDDAEYRLALARLKELESK